MHKKLVFHGINPHLTPILKLNFGRDNFFGCDSFISSLMGRWGIAMAGEA